MLNKLHRPKWQHKDPEIRQQAVASLDPEKAEDVSIISHLALKDDAEQVRETAIKQLRDVHVLLDIIQTQTSQNEKKAATQQIRHLLSEPTNGKSRPQESRAEWLNKIFDLNDNTLSPIEVAKIAVESDTGLFAFERIQDQQGFLDLVQSAKQVKVKLAAIEKINSASELKSLQKTVSEKSVLQIIRDKLKKHKAAEEERARLFAEAEKTCSTIEKLAPLPFDERYAKRLQKLIEQWQHIDASARNELQARFNEAHKQCRDTVAQYEAEQQKKEALTNAKKSQADINRKLGALKQTLTDNTDTSNIQESLDALATQWQEAGLILTPNDKEAKQYYQTVEAIAAFQQQSADYQAQEKELEQQLAALAPLDDTSTLSYKQAKERVQALKTLSQSIRWPKGFDKPKLLITLDQYLASWQTTRDQINKANKVKLEQIHKKTIVLQKEIRKKNLISANRLYNYIQKQLEGLDEHFQEKEAARLSRVSESLTELRDWHQFATQPKKEALCEKMESLLEAEQAPMQRAELIKTLQTEWKQLNSSNSEIDQALWDRFKAASDKAFEPCLAHYAELDAQRAENLKKRMQVCDQLETFVQSADWSNIDWKKVESVEKNARNEWSRYKPVPNKEVKAIQKRFDSVVKQVREKLDSEREKNLEERKLLIERANALSNLEDLNQAIEQAISLQKQWKEIGITFFRQDQKQWKKFRAACNKVFERRDKERVANKEKVESEVGRAKEIIASLKTHHALEDEALIKAKPELVQLRAEFQQLTKSMPLKLSKGLKADYKETNKQIDKQLAGVDGRKRRNRFSAVEEVVALCERQERGDNDESLAQRLNEQLVSLPKKHQSALRKRVSSAELYAALSDQEKNSSMQANAKHRAEISLELEILIDIPSPEEFRSDRTAYQLQQLQQGLQARLTEEERKDKVQSLLLTWLAAGPISESEQEPAKQRFELIKKAVFC